MNLAERGMQGKVPPPPPPPMTMTPATLALPRLPSEALECGVAHNIRTLHRDIGRSVVYFTLRLRHHWPAHRYTVCVDSVCAMDLPSFTKPCLAADGFRHMRSAKTHGVPVLALPFDVWSEVVAFLPPRDVVALGGCCARVRALALCEPAARRKIAQTAPRSYEYLTATGDWHRWVDYFIRHTAKGIHAVDVRHDMSAPSNHLTQLQSCCRYLVADLATSFGIRFDSNSVNKGAESEERYHSGTVGRAHVVLALWSPPAAPPTERLDCALHFRSVRNELSCCVATHATELSDLSQETLFVRLPRYLRSNATMSPST